MRHLFYVPVYVACFSRANIASHNQTSSSRCFPPPVRGSSKNTIPHVSTHFQDSPQQSSVDYRRFGLQTSMLQPIEIRACVFFADSTRNKSNVCVLYVCCTKLLDVKPPSPCTLPLPTFW